ncbi:MAG: glycosyltransferase family 39 protein [Chloroflexota bacterium]
MSAISPERLKRAAFPILLALAFLLLLGMLLRNVDQPLLDRHGTRQVDTAWVAKGLATGQFSVFRPVFLAHYPDAYGIDGATETEFMLYPLIVSLLYRLFGVHEVIARLVAVAFSMGTALWLYLLGREYLDRAAGLLAVLFLSTSPLFVFYGRSVQPEAAVLFFSVGALCLFTRWLRSEGWAAFVGATALALCAFLVKIPALLIGLPLLVAAWLKYGWALWRQPRLWLFAALTLIPTAAYYAQAHAIYRATGQTIWGLVGGWTGIEQVDLVSNLLSRDFYNMLLVRARNNMFGRWGLMALLGGLALRPRQHDEATLYAWLGAVVLFVLVFAQKHRQHEYYQLPLIPVGALFIGRALSALTHPGNLNLDLLVVRRRLGVLLVAGILALNGRIALHNLAPMYAQSAVLLEVANATQRLTPPDQPIVIIHDWAREGEVFYYAERRGWSIWIVRTDAGEYGDLIVAERVKTATGWEIPKRLEGDLSRLELLAGQGASSVVVSLEKGTRAEFERSPIGRALEARYRRLGANEHWLIYDLRASR